MLVCHRTVMPVCYGAGMSPTTIALIGLKGGVGKTTTAVHLAEAGVQRFGSALLVDADPRGSALKWAESGGEGEPVLSSAVIGLATPDLARRLRQLDTPARFTIIDTGGGRPEISLGALNTADVAIVPITPSVLDVLELGATLDLATKTVTPAAVLITRAQANTIALRELRAVLEDQELPVLRTVIPDRQSIARAAGAQLDQRWVDLHADVLDEIINAIKED